MKSLIKRLFRKIGTLLLRDYLSSELAALQRALRQDTANSLTNSLTNHLKLLAKLQTVPAARVLKFSHIYERLAPWVDMSAFSQNYEELMEKVVQSGGKVEDIFMDAAYKVDNTVCFKNAELKFQDKAKAFLNMNELLIEEEYYFEPETDTPLIVDCGANIGLAVYYFKTRFPKARIIAFEPAPISYQILCENIKNNRWTDVDAYPYALSDKEEAAELHIPEDDSLGGTLTSRVYDTVVKNPISDTTVQTKLLSDYITSPVDFLKLDIEAMELRVLKELVGGGEDKLSLVKNIFCEYHYSSLVDDNSLTELLDLLDSHGFDYQVNKSPSFYEATRIRSMRHVGKRCSFNIWAKKKSR